MRVFLLLAFAFAFSTTAAQQNPACSSDNHRLLDFWVGEWDLTWPGGQGGTPEGQTGHGENIITKTLDDCVIHESFSGQGFDGQSVSIYDASSSEWKQTWVDNQGGFIAFTGGINDGTMEFRTTSFTDPQGNDRINRMIWEDVEEDSFTWRWQTSNDDGESWSDQWVIAYTRK